MSERKENIVLSDGSIITVLSSKLANKPIIEMRNEVEVVIGYEKYKKDEYEDTPDETGTYQPALGRIAKEFLFNNRMNKITEINIACALAITSGFTSTAKEGQALMYQSEQTDQMNLIGAATTGIRQNVKCRASVEDEWKYVDHLATEIKQLLKDGAAVVAAHLAKAAQLKAAVKSALSVEEINQIKW